jgi:hypothetical protein
LEFGGEGGDALGDGVDLGKLRGDGATISDLAETVTMFSSGVERLTSFTVDG